MSISRMLGRLALPIVMSGALLCAPPALAQFTLIVNTTNDTIALTPGSGTGLDANGEVSLRSAIMEVNAQIAGGVAGPFEVLLDYAAIFPPPLDPCTAPAPQVEYELTITANPLDPAYHPDSARWDDLDIIGLPGGPPTVTIRPINGCGLLGGGVIQQDPNDQLSPNPYPIPCLDATMPIPLLVTRPAAQIAWNLLPESDRARIFDAFDVNLELIDLELRGGRAGDGGAIRSQEGNVHASRLLFFDNAADGHGGGAYFLTGSTHSLLVEQSRMCICQATLNGGGIAVTGAMPMFSMNDTLIRSSKTHTRKGGGLFTNSGISIIEDSAINECEAALGGGAYLRGSVTINRSRIMGNSANGLVPFPHGPIDPVSAGGGLYVDGNVSLNESNVNVNTVHRGAGSPPHDRGGGMYVSTFGSLDAHRSSILDNAVGSFDPFDLNGHGGGVHSDGSLRLTNCTVADNLANAHGGGVYVNAGSASLNHVTIVRNSLLKPAPEISSGLGIAGGNVNVRSTMIAENQVMDPVTFPAFQFIMSGNCGVHPLFGPGPATDYNLDSDGSCVLAGWFGPNSILSGPGANFTPTRQPCGVTEVYPLLFSADAIDNADPACSDDLGNIIIVDQCGNARPQGPQCDIGALEGHGAPPPCLPLPPNDDCLVSPMPVLEGVWTVDSTCATTDGPAGPPGCGFTGVDDADVWFFFVAECTKEYRITVEDASGNMHDRYAAVYDTGCPQAGGSLLTCGVAFAGGTVELAFDAAAGESFIIRLGSPPGQDGLSNLIIERYCPADLNNDNTVNVFDLLALLAMWGQSCQCGPTPPPTPSSPCNVFSMLDLLAAWGPCP